MCRRMGSGPARLGRPSGRSVRVKHSNVQEHGEWTGKVGEAIRKVSKGEAQQCAGGWGVDRHGRGGHQEGQFAEAGDRISQEASTPKGVLTYYLAKICRELQEK